MTRDRQNLLGIGWMALPDAATAGRIAAAGFGALAVFEIALASGAPLGRAAFGGYYTVLPTELRVVAVAAAGVWSYAALAMLKQSGHDVRIVTERAARVTVTVLAWALPAGVLMNLASQSDWERYLLAPFAAVLAALCWRVRYAGKARVTEQASRWRPRWRSGRGWVG
jgi:hypothetical protein